MSWLQLDISVQQQELADLEALVLAQGAVAISLIEPDDLPDPPIFEPKPGQTPLWQHLVLQVLLPLDLELSGLREALLAFDAAIGERMTFAFIAEQDWLAQTAEHALDKTFAGRLRVMPPPVQPRQPQASVVTMYLQPGLAFGSGRHPTTQLCLHWLAEHLVGDMRVLDFGCGSGVLGIAAALLGCQVTAVDYDKQACLATLENAQSNQVASQVEVHNLDQWQARDDGFQFDVVVANILATPLIELAPQFEQVLSPGGKLVLSGVLPEQAPQVMAAYGGIQFDVPVTEQGWSRLSGRREGLSKQHAGDAGR